MTRETLERKIARIMVKYYDHLTDVLVGGSHGLEYIVPILNVYDTPWEDLDDYYLELGYTYHEAHSNPYTVKENFVITTKGLVHEFSGSTSENFSTFFKIPKDVEDSLVKDMIKCTINTNGKCPMGIYKKLPDIAIDAMNEEGYFNKFYTSDELIELYELIDDVRILPEETRNIFFKSL
jgi:hypothetical protein